MHIKIYLACTVDRNKTSRVLVTDETTQRLVKVLQGRVGLVVDTLTIISLHHAPLIAFLFRLMPIIILGHKIGVELSTKILVTNIGKTRSEMFGQITGAAAPQVLGKKVSEIFWHIFTEILGQTTTEILLKFRVILLWRSSRDFRAGKALLLRRLLLNAAIA